MRQIKRFVKLSLGLPLTIISFLFIGKILLGSLPQVMNHFFNADITLLLLGVFSMLLFFLIRSIAWAKVLEFYGASEKGTVESVYAYTLAETKRYIPGNIFSFVSRVQKFSTENLPKKTVVSALALEAFVMVTSAFIISIPAIVTFPNLDSYFFIIPILVVLFALFAFAFLKNIFNLKSLFQSVFPRKSLFAYLNVISVSALAWAFFGLANFFFMISLFPSDPNLILKLVSIFTLAWLIGYVSFFAPMGLGVREAVLVYLLTPFTPVFAGAAIAVFSRMFLIVSEIIFLALSFFIHKKLSFEKHLKSIFPLILVSLGVFTYTVYFTYVSVSRHLNFYSGKFDLGNMENTLWNTLHGNFFMFSSPDGANELSRLSAHADFILLLFVPFYFLYPSVNTLLVAQSLIIGIGGFFVYLIAKKVLKSEKLSVLFSFGYFLNFFVQEQNIFDFHSVSLATAFLLAAFYFVLIKRVGISILFLILAALTKENVYMVTALFGGYIFLNGKRLTGGMISVVSIAIFIFLMSYAIPLARGGEHFALDYLSYLGSNPLEILLSPILKPDIFFGKLFSIQTFEYIKTAFMPVGYFSVFAPLYVIFLLPDFLINIFSSNPNLQSIQYHYGALLVPFIYISAIFGVRKITAKKGVSKNFVFYFLLLFIILSTWHYSPLPGMLNSDTAAFKKTSNRSEILMALQDISKEKSIGATNNIAAHLVQRENIYILPHGIETSDYLVFYNNNLDMAYELMTVENFIVTFNDYNLIILKRVNPADRVYIP